ncbi:sensor histidine kinase [uncultured Kordia sp.]|uniref:sensor histidine kinase n=1 Tax=uncultured Kordia sp. TaxID=507699 RepID=UPI00260C5F70|nr:histidine kinase [uncultured Kordia sp.]
MASFRIENILKREIYLHLLFWTLYITYPLLKHIDSNYILVQWITANSNIVLLLVLVYVCYYFFFPWRNRYKIPLLLLFFGVMTVLGVFFSEAILNLYIYHLDGYSYKTHALGILSEYILVSLIFYSFYSFKKSYILSNHLRIAELKNLKSQINPHFLFNTLNNIYAYTLTNNEKASELILKLSDNFKYILREGKKEQVSVELDWQHIKDFIYINSLRWEDKIVFEIDEEITNNKLLISPLILITFVENAVKYTSKLKGENRIVISLKINNEELFFTCKNPYNAEYVLSDDWESSGIGLKNTKKRLELLYPNRHELIIEDQNALFNVMLKLDLC